MRTEYTNDDHKRDQDFLSDLANAFGYGDTDEKYRRCPMCGDMYPVDEFDTYDGQDMCFECVELERTNSASETYSIDSRELLAV